MMCQEVVKPTNYLSTRRSKATHDEQTRISFKGQAIKDLAFNYRRNTLAIIKRCVIKHFFLQLVARNEVWFLVVERCFTMEFVLPG